MSSDDTDLLGCDAASSGDNLKECTAFTHPLTEPHIPGPYSSTMLLMTNSPWIGGLQHINKGLKLVPECITDSGLAFTCASRDSSPTGVTHPSYCRTKEVLIMKEKAESETKLHVLIPEKTGILKRQNESKNRSLLGCDSIIWQTNLDVLKKHSARVLDPEDEGTTILQRWKQLTQ